MVQSGIYKITIGDRFYIGSAANLHYRWGQHKAGFRNGKHINPFIQHAWDKHGAASFEVITLCPVSCLLGMEQYYIDRYWDSQKMCMNIARDAAAPMHGRSHSDATRAKMVLNHSDNSGENNPNFGKRGVLNPFYGRHHSDESKKAMAAAKAGKPGNRLGTHMTEVQRIANIERQKGLRYSPSSEFKKGQVSAFKGHKMTEESKQRVRAAQQKRRSLERAEADS